MPVCRGRRLAARSRAVQPKLAALSGPLRKSEFQVGGILSIGRSPSNSICIEDGSVSPSHCRIDCNKERYLLTDLDSGSGTFVNGIPVKERVLASGDQIAVGNSLFLFQLEDSPASASSPVELDENPLAGGQIQQLRPDELLYLIRSHWQPCLSRRAWPAPSVRS